ncbi:MAG: protein kinase [Myxococcota bacterium]
MSTSDPHGEGSGSPTRARLADSVEEQRTAAAVMSGLFGDEAGPALAGRFRLIERRGAGTMGSVYLAEDTELGRHVAVKRLSSSSAGAAFGEQTKRRRARMVREARSLAKVSHPNVVVVHDVRTEGRDVFVAMEFVPGQTIHRWLQGGSCSVSGSYAARAPRDPKRSRQPCRRDRRSSPMCSWPSLRTAP